MEKGNKSQRINILISQALNHQLSQAAKRSGVTKSAFIRVALEREFDRDKKLENEIAARDLLS